MKTIECDCCKDTNMGCTDFFELTLTRSIEIELLPNAISTGRQDQHYDLCYICYCRILSAVDKCIEELKEENGGL